MDEHLLSTYRRQEEIFLRGQGVRLRDDQGRTFLDFLSGIGVSSLGHRHPRLTAALRDQVDKLLHVSNLYRTELSEDVATRLARLTGLEAVLFCNSGSESVEAALKLARKHQRSIGKPERSSFLALQGSFHGRTAGALSVTSNPAYRQNFSPLLSAQFVEPEDESALREALASTDLAAMILEPVQGEGGIRPLSSNYLQLARELCTQSGTLLIHDEVQCGVGRTGHFLAADAAGVKPDLLCLAKPLAAGIPIGALVAGREFAQVFEPGDHGSTFGGGPLALRAAQVVLDELETGGLLLRVQQRGEQLAAGLAGLVETSTLASGTRGAGLMQGLIVPGRATDVVREAHGRQLLCAQATADVVRFLPPYILTSDDVDEALSILSESLAALED